MIILHATAKNFQSYETIDFSYNKLGLCLVSGPTGVGKSTLLDLVFWTLYGDTSKGGSADSIRSWGSEEQTSGACDVSTPNGPLTVHRCRAPNDLYWTESDQEEKIRGKDLIDTQKLLDARLGASAELFLLGSYLTQFSEADSFFVAKAKDRREVLEKIADQEWAVTLAEKTSEKRKSVRKSIESLQAERSEWTGKLSVLTRQVVAAGLSSEEWEASRTAKVFRLQQLNDTFETQNAETIAQLEQKSSEWESRKLDKITRLANIFNSLHPAQPDHFYREPIAQLTCELRELQDTRCQECGALKEHKESDRIRAGIDALTEERADNARHRQKRELAYVELKVTEDLENPHLSGLKQAKVGQNPYSTQVQADLNEINPFCCRVEEGREDIKASENSLREVEIALKEAQTLFDRLLWLYDKSFELRGLLMERAVTHIQEQTNAYIEKHFDGAIRILLSIEDSDKIEVEIYNNGHLANFKSLSGGERCILKLAFSLSLMKSAQDKAGVSFGQLFLDEPLAGLDEGLKVQAFSLLQELSLEYPTILVIEHSEAFKNCFDTKFVVAKSCGKSRIEIYD